MLVPSADVGVEAMVEFDPVAAKVIPTVNPTPPGLYAARISPGRVRLAKDKDGNGVWSVFVIFVQVLAVETLN